MQLTEPPRLMAPTVAVRDSWLAAERAETAQEGASTELLDAALADFGQFVAARLGTPVRWGVPISILWYISGAHYLGELTIRHELTPALADTGGHVGYWVAPQWRRRGHATAMLAAGLGECRRLGLSRVLVTCAAGNEASRRVILANNGVPDAPASNGDLRFWITTGGVGARPGPPRVTG